MSGDLTLWYAIRAFGLVAYALLTASMLWGLWLSTRAPLRRGRPWVLEVHRALGALALLFTGAHLVALLADGYIGFSVVEVLVPFASDWNRAAVAWGTVGLYLLAAVEVTSLLRRRIGHGAWRKVHGAAFGAYLVASLHFLTAGTDATNRVALAVFGAGFALVAAGTLYRLAEVLEPQPEEVVHA